MNRSSDLHAPYPDNAAMLRITAGQDTSGVSASSAIYHQPQQQQSHPVVVPHASTFNVAVLPHKCHLCTMSFTKESGLKRHMKVHRPKQTTTAVAAAVPTPPIANSSASARLAAEPPFMCNICRLVLGNATELRDHVDSQHYWNTAPVEKCMECGCFRPVTAQCATSPYRCESCTFHYQVRTGRSLAMASGVQQQQQQQQLTPHQQLQQQQCQPHHIQQQQQQQQQQHLLHLNGGNSSTAGIHHQQHQQQTPQLLGSIPNASPKPNASSTKTTASLLNSHNTSTSSVASSGNSSNSGSGIIGDRPPAHRSKAYRCPDCPKSFAHANTLTMHRKIHAGEFKYLCEYCDKPFVLQDYYVRHLRVHTKEKPYACDLCDKRFSQSNTLTQHRRTHTGEKPFVCPQCGKPFGVRDYLNKHMRVHTGEKPYGCTVCGKKYSQPSALRSHQKQHAHLPSSPAVGGSGGDDAGEADDLPALSN